MIETVRFDDRVSTAGQLRALDLAGIARVGFRVVVNNRPDGEALIEQQSSDAMAAAAVAASLASHYLPIRLAELGPVGVRAFHDPWRGPRIRCRPSSRAASATPCCG